MILRYLLLPDILELVEEGRLNEVRDFLSKQPAQEITEFLDAIDDKNRVLIFRVLPRALAGEVFSLLEPSSQNTADIGTCDSGPVNIYVKDGAVQVVGLWGGAVLDGTLSGSSFTAVGEVAARLAFPAAHLIVSGDVGGSSCSARVDGYSSDPARPGNFTGHLSTTRR